MARHNRRRPEPDRGDGFDRMLAGWKRTESRASGEWTVQPVSGAKAQKNYTCPGCSGTVTAGTAHLVAWRADGVMGDAADLAARRHWHTHCWRLA